MSYTTKFSSIAATSANAAVPLQPLLVQPLEEASSPRNPLPSPTRRHDDRLPFMIHAGDVVVIDGNHGHDHIDLRGYSVDDALFQGDTIEINREKENHFVIEYKNVRQAVFSGDVSVDL